MSGMGWESPVLTELYHDTHTHRDYINMARIPALSWAKELLAILREVS